MCRKRRNRAPFEMKPIVRDKRMARTTSRRHQAVAGGEEEWVPYRCRMDRGGVPGLNSVRCVGSGPSAS